MANFDNKSDKEIEKMLGSASPKGREAIMEALKEDGREIPEVPPRELGRKAVARAAIERREKIGKKEQ